MSEPNVDSSRRDFLRAAAGTATVTAATGTAAAAEDGGGGGGGGGQPDYGGWLDGVGNYDGSTEDLRGQSEVTISVGASGNGGNYAFDPPAVWIDTGTTVTWEWTGQGGGHNVVHDGDAFSSQKTAQEGFTFSHTFEEGGIFNYLCEPHEGLGMKGSVAVGGDVPTVQPDTGSAGPVLPDSAKTLGIASGFAMVSTLGLAYFFMKYGGDYEAIDA